MGPPRADTVDGVTHSAEPAHHEHARHLHDGVPAVAGDFDSRARTWDEPAKIARATAIAERIVALVELPDGARGLDVGCGTGLGTWPIADRFAHVTLADASTGMIEVVRERLAERADAGRFDARVLDLTTDRLEDSSYDVAWSVMALHHVTPLAPALATLAAALRPGGTLAVADLDADPGGLYHSGSADIPHHGFDRGELTTALEEAGLHDVRFETVYSITKEVDGHPRDFPVFLALARR